MYKLKRFQEQRTPDEEENLDFYLPSKRINVSCFNLKFVLEIKRIFAFQKQFPYIKYRTSKRKFNP